MHSNLKLTKDALLVEVLPREEIKIGSGTSLIMPGFEHQFNSTDKLAACWAKVLAAGPEVKDFKVGAIILLPMLNFTPYSQFLRPEFTNMRIGTVAAKGVTCFFESLESYEQTLKEVL